MKIIDQKEYRCFLRDGTPALVRLFRPEDRRYLLEGFERLSKASRRSRFLSPISRLTPEQAAYLSAVDDVNHLAWAAADLTRGEHYGIGIARYVRLGADSTVAEAAIAVVDSYQGKGVGSLLFGQLVESAIRNDVRVLRSFVYPDNLSMIRILGRYAAVRRRLVGPLLQLDLELSAVTARSRAG